MYDLHGYTAEKPWCEERMNGTILLYLTYEPAVNRDGQSDEVQNINTSHLGLRHILSYY